MLKLVFSLFLFPIISFAEEKFFVQLIDHQNPVEGTFSQRYFLNEENRRGENSPVVFVLCGEGSCFENGEGFLSTLIAKNSGATVISLEHRYYGVSQPFSNIETSSLRFLSVAQAIQDINNFQKFIDPFNKRKWFVMGSSYAGSLAAFYRQKYPELTVGALASSAPVQAKYAFTEYDQFSSDALGDVCSKKVRELVAEVEQSLDSPKRMAVLKAYFHVPYIQDDQNFLFLISEFTTGLIQFGWGQKLCEDIEAGSAIKALSGLVNLFYEDGRGYDLSTWGFETLNITTINEQSIARQWWYQVCTEMGFFQVANPDRQHSIRSMMLNESFYQELCKKYYNVSHTNIAEFNQQYYEPLRLGQYSRIIFTNGTQDPWRELSILPDSAVVFGPESYAWINEGGSHSSELYLQTDEPNEMQARIVSTVTQWLKR